jgi:hypothetical protein
MRWQILFAVVMAVLIVVESVALVLVLTEPVLPNVLKQGLVGVLMYIITRASRGWLRLNAKPSSRKKKEGQ